VLERIGIPKGDSHEVWEIGLPERGRCAAGRRVRKQQEGCVDDDPVGVDDGAGCDGDDGGVSAGDERHGGGGHDSVVGNDTVIGNDPVERNDRVVCGGDEVPADPGWSDRVGRLHLAQRRWVELRAAVPGRFQDRLDLFNAQFPNGIDGHPVQITVLDDQTTATGAVQVANQLIDKKVAAVVSTSFAAGVDQQFTAFNAAKVPVIGYLLSDKYADPAAFPYAFSVAPTLKTTAEATAKWLDASGLKRLAFISDGSDSSKNVIANVKTALTTLAPNTTVVDVEQYQPGATDVSTQVAAVKAAKPDVVYATSTTGGFTPVWQAMRTANLTDVAVLASPGAWYAGFDAMGPLQAKAYSPYTGCAASVDATFGAPTVKIMDAYRALFPKTFVNMLTDVQNESVPLALIKSAIEKYHSVDPDAIKRGLEETKDTFYDIQFAFSPTNHNGVTGDYGAAVCTMAPPYAGGTALIPISSKKYVPGSAAGSTTGTTPSS